MMPTTSVCPISASWAEGRDASLRGDPDRLATGAGGGGEHVHPWCGVVVVAAGEVGVAVGRDRLVVAVQHQRRELVARAVGPAVLEHVGQLLEACPREEQQVAAVAGQV